jgi:hypothetical protein
VRRLRILPALLALLLCARAVPAPAHGGFPLRLGVAAQPELLALSQVIVLSLRDGQGMSVERKVYPDAGALRRGWQAREVDFILDLPAEEARAAGGLPETACGPGIEAAVAERYRNADGPATVEFFAVSLTASPCARPGIVVRGSVAANLRYSTLRDALRRAAAAVRREDLDRLVAAAAGGERALVKAVREFLESKGVR